MSDQTDPEPGPNLTLLKWIVGILGFLIVLFAGIIGVTIFMRLTATETDSLIDEPKMAIRLNDGKVLGSFNLEKDGIQ